jgi:uncharacterized protein (TIGR02271 family)
MIDTTNLPGLIGANVIDSDGDKIGTAAQIYVDTTTGEPNWATVRTGLFGTSETFVPLANANVRGDEIHVAFQKQFVKDAPRIDADGDLSPEDERILYDYYGMGYDDTFVGTAEGDVGRAGDFDDSRRGSAESRAAADGRAATDARRGSADSGYDTSGPTTDDAMTRSEERLNVGTERVQAGRARLRKYVVTENQNVTVPVSREEVRVEREPITDANRSDATSGPDISEEEHEMTLNEERVVVDKDTVPVERVRMDKDTVTEERNVNADVRKEQIEVDAEADRVASDRADSDRLDSDRATTNRTDSDRRGRRGSDRRDPDML